MPGCFEFTGTALKPLISPFSTMLANKRQEGKRGTGREGRKMVNNQTKWYRRAAGRDTSEAEWECLGKIGSWHALRL